MYNLDKHKTKKKKKELKDQKREPKTWRKRNGELWGHAEADSDVANLVQEGTPHKLDQRSETKERGVGHRICSFYFFKLSHCGLNF